MIINFDNDKAYLNDSYYLPVSSLSLTDKNSKFRLCAWKIKVISFNNNIIFGDIVLYNNNQIPFSDYQQQDKQIELAREVKFRKIDTTGLLNSLVSKNKHHYDMPYIPSSEPHEDPKLLKAYPFLKPKDAFTEIREHFTFPITELSFKNGFVQFEKWIDSLRKKVEIKIHNPAILEEFDAVKEYFIDALKTKNITVELFIKEPAESCVGNSKEIDSINDKIINEARIEVIKQMVNNDSKSNARIFAEDNLLDSFNIDKLSSEEYSSKILEDMISISSTKHYEYLRFLSKKHVYKISRLRYVLKPFSFLFIVKGEQGYYGIWETLDTEEATYIFDLGNSGENGELMKDLELYITSIKNTSKLSFIRDNSDILRRIQHDYTGVDGFKKWEHHLNSHVNFVGS